MLYQPGEPSVIADIGLAARNGGEPVLDRRKGDGFIFYAGSIVVGSTIGLT